MKLVYTYYGIFVKTADVNKFLKSSRISLITDETGKEIIKNKKQTLYRGEYKIRVDNSLFTLKHVPSNFTMAYGIKGSAFMIGILCNFYPNPTLLSLTRMFKTSYRDQFGGLFTELFPLYEPENIILEEYVSSGASATPPLLET
jgi:hypothetical protein